MKPIRIFRHVDWIESGRLAEYLDERAIAWELVAIDRGDPIPQRLDDVAGLAFLGGTMSVNDDLPWIADETRLIRSAIERDVPVLGHCLGSQLMAKALGASVTVMAAKEIGWHTVYRLDNAVARDWLGDADGGAELLLWHHDAFTLPPGATPVLSNENCAIQGFAIGNSIATVAHPEVTEPMLEQWLRNYGYDIEPNGSTVQSIEAIKGRLRDRCAKMHARFTDPLYEAWLQRLRIS
jgi:GMP synthase-like glutamine amidotransferase